MNSQAPQSLAARNVLWAWFLAIVSGTAASLVVLMITGQANKIARTIPMWATGLSVVAMWVAMLVVIARTRAESPRINRAMVAWFRSIDVVAGIPLGIASQIILVSAVNWPLQKIWPDFFSFDEVSQRATDLSNTATGSWKLVLVAVVVVGAPLVEEIVYRGTMQPALEKQWGTKVGIILTAAIFALIHQSLVELPGLFAFALVLGLLRYRTGRLGTSIITHMAFNAAGLVMVILK